MNLRMRTARMLDQDLYGDRSGQWLNLFLITLITLNVIAIFLESVDAIFARYGLAFWYFEVFSVIVFTIEYLARVWSSIDLERTSDNSRLVGRIKYMLTPLALVDLIAILPFYLSLYVSFDLRFLRGLRLLRLFKLTRYSPALSALLDVIQKESEALLAAIVVLLIMLVMSAAGIYVLENDLQPETFGSMPSSMWWAIVTLTTVGYGDVVPVTTLGKMFAGLIGLIGIGMIALPAAIMASGFAENVRSRKEEYNLHVRQFLKDGRLDTHERGMLEELRKELGLDSDEASQLMLRMKHEAGDTLPDKCPKCGEPLGPDPS